MIIEDLILDDKRITGLASPVGNTDAINKAYFDENVWKIGGNDIAVPEGSEVYASIGTQSEAGLNFLVNDNTAISIKPNGFSYIDGVYFGKRRKTYENIFIGENAGIAFTTGSDNILIGKYACSGGNMLESVCIGTASCVNSNATGVVAVGFRTGASSTAPMDCTFVGAFAGEYNSSGQSNTYIGAYAGNSNTTANSCTIIGSDMNGSNSSNELIIGAGNIYMRGLNNKVLLGNAPLLKQPHTTLQSHGGLALSVKRIEQDNSSNIRYAGDDGIFLLKDGEHIELPIAENCIGRIYTFIKMDVGASIEVRAGVTDKINGAIAYTLTNVYDSVTMAAVDNENWVILSKNA